MALHIVLSMTVCLFLNPTLFVKGIPRPLPLNKRLNGDSLILEDEDLIREQSSKSVEDTEEFKKAVETFDEIFLSEDGDQSSEANKRLSKKLETSPNVNWKRIKTSRSIEAEETMNQLTETKEEIGFKSETSFQKTEQYSSYSEESSYTERQESSLEENHKKISILGNQYNSPIDVSEEQGVVIQPDVLKNVDGPSIQSKGSSKAGTKSENLPEEGGRLC